jgi:hypothetical protein
MPTRRHQIRNAMETLYMKAISSSDIRAAQWCLRELGQLDGLYASQKVEVLAQGQIGVGISLAPLGFTSAEDVQKRIDELRARIKAGNLDSLTDGKSGMVPTNILSTGNVLGKPNGSNGTGN